MFFKSAKVEGADGLKPWKKLPAALPQPLLQFIEAVAGKPGPGTVTAREAAERVSLMAAAYRAARERAWLAPA